MSDSSTAGGSQNTPETIHDASDFGTVATHQGLALPPVLVGPATNNELNTISLGLPAIACMSLHDLVFETDSSFVMPDAAKVLKNLPALRQGHKTKTGDLPVLSIFAHADPSGTDDYNKSLSGRRASSVYGLLLHDVTVWQNLYNNPLGGDNWQKKNVDDTMRAMLGAGAPAARGDLFLAYMKAMSPLVLKKTDFLGRGASPAGKADYQGCSDFNPLLLLTQDENENMAKSQWRLLNRCNRRVVIFLFCPTRKIHPDLWPCPTAAESAAGCKKRFFSDASTRRASTGERREFSKTKDTFSCRFYQFFSESSPCERILHYLRIRLFDHFGNPIYNARYQMEFAGASTTDIATDSYGKLADVEVPASGKVRWSRPYSEDDVTTLPADSDQYEYEIDLFIDDKEAEREECAKRRLNNLGYLVADTLDQNIREFQQDIGRAAPDGSLDDIFDELEKRHHDCDPPKRHPV